MRLLYPPFPIAYFLNMSSAFSMSDLEPAILDIFEQQKSGKERNIPRVINVLLTMMDLLPYRLPLGNNIPVKSISCERKQVISNEQQAL